MPLSRRRFLGLAAASPAAYLLAGCLGSDDPEVRVTADGSPVAGHSVSPVQEAPTPRAVPFEPPSPASSLNVEDLTGFTFPVEGACLPSNDGLMPNAPRDDGARVHEGLDFTFGDACVVIERGTPVLAMYAGVVTRADHAYEDLTAEALAEAEDRAAAAGDANDAEDEADGENGDGDGEEDGDAQEELRDLLHGRQVWIDHGNGVLSRYARLDEIGPHIGVGVNVQAGEPIGAVGESGTRGAITEPGSQIRLHVEVRVGGSFYGDGHDPDTVRTLYQRLFTSADGEAPAEGERPEEG